MNISQQISWFISDVFDNLLVVLFILGIIIAIFIVIVILGYLEELFGAILLLPETIRIKRKQRKLEKEKQARVKKFNDTNREVANLAKEEIGKLGETKVLDVVDNLDAKYFPNMYLISNNEKRATEVDGIIISSRAIYVLEIKNYTGTIYPNEGKNWGQFFITPENRTINKYIYSPAWQNRAHIEFLQQISDIFKKLPVISLIVIDDRTEISPNPDIQKYKDFIVCKTSSLEKVYRELEEQHEPHDMSAAIETLTEMRKKEDLAKVLQKQAVQNARERVF